MSKNKKIVVLAVGSKIDLQHYFKRAGSMTGAIDNFGAEGKVIAINDDGTVDVEWTKMGNGTMHGPDGELGFVFTYDGISEFEVGPIGLPTPSMNMRTLPTDVYNRLQFETIQ